MLPWREQIEIHPRWIGNLAELTELRLNENLLTELPETIVNLNRLRMLTLYGNRLSFLPEWIGKLTSLEELYASNLGLESLPTTIGNLTKLREFTLHQNRIRELPLSFGKLESLREFLFSDNPLNPELAAAYKEGLDAVKRYLRAKAEVQVVLNEAKLILIGEGEVGKSCLLGALRGDPWEKVAGLPSTHGIEIKPVKVTDSATGTEITLNGWDFGGQRVYRPRTSCSSAHRRSIWWCGNRERGHRRVR